MLVSESCCLLALCQNRVACPLALTLRCIHIWYAALPTHASTLAAAMSAAVRHGTRLRLLAGTWVQKRHTTRHAIRLVRVEDEDGALLGLAEVLEHGVEIETHRLLPRVQCPRTNPFLSQPVSSTRARHAQRQTQWQCALRQGQSSTTPNPVPVRDQSAAQQEAEPHFIVNYSKTY
jgi:hypothetical protein